MKENEASKSTWKDKLVNSLKKHFEPQSEEQYNFTLQDYDESSSIGKASGNLSTKQVQENENFAEVKDIFPSLDVNLEYVKVKYNTLINSDIVIREFTLSARNRQYKAFLFFIDGMVDSELINDNILQALMLRNRANTFDGDEKQVVLEGVTNNITVKRVKKFNLESYITNSLLPQNNLEKVTTFSDAFSGVNIGNCLLFVDTLPLAFDIDVKGFKQRDINKAENEIIIQGPQEAFVENLRTNTSLIRRIVNNENLVIENLSVGKLSKTKCCVCYMKNIANSYLVAEVKYRLNNLGVDSIFSSGELEQLIEEDVHTSVPQILKTERPDKASKYIYEGRVVVIVNGNPYVLVMPVTLIDFIASPEDTNLRFQFANFLKFLRLFAIVITLLLPGLYIALTDFHQELLPTELLFSILASRENVPFPIIFEVLIMEISFELIREAGIRVPSPIGPTIGIVGGLVIGQAAVSASIVSPILLIIIAITAIASFAIPDFSFGFHLRLMRFVFIILRIYCRFFWRCSWTFYICLFTMQFKIIWNTIHCTLCTNNKLSEKMFSFYRLLGDVKKEQTFWILNAKKGKNTLV